MHLLIEGIDFDKFFTELSNEDFIGFMTVLSEVRDILKDAGLEKTCNRLINTENVVYGSFIYASALDTEFQNLSLKLSNYAAQSLIDVVDLQIDTSPNVFTDDFVTTLENIRDQWQPISIISNKDIAEKVQMSAIGKCRWLFNTWINSGWMYQSKFNGEVSPDTTIRININDHNSVKRAIGYHAYIFY